MYRFVFWTVMYIITGQPPSTLSCEGYNSLKYPFSSLSFYYSLYGLRHGPRNTSTSPGDAPHCRMLASTPTPGLQPVRCQTEIIRELADAWGGTFTNIAERGWVLLWRYVPPQFWIPVFISDSYFHFTYTQFFSLQVDLMKQRASIAVLDFVIGASPTTGGTNMCVVRRFVYVIKGATFVRRAILSGNPSFGFCM